MPNTLLEAVENLKKAYQQLSPNSVDVLLKCYSADARFKDPFQEVQGHAAIQHIFLKMYEQLINPSFVIREELMGDHLSLIHI